MRIICISVTRTVRKKCSVRWPPLSPIGWPCRRAAAAPSTRPAEFPSVRSVSMRRIFSSPNCRPRARRMTSVCARALRSTCPKLRPEPPMAPSHRRVRPVHRFARPTATTSGPAASSCPVNSPPDPHPAPPVVAGPAPIRIFAIPSFASTIRPLRSPRGSSPRQPSSLPSATSTRRLAVSSLNSSNSRQNWFHLIPAPSSGELNISWILNFKFTFSWNVNEMIYIFLKCKWNDKPNWLMMTSVPSSGRYLTTLNLANWPECVEWRKAVTLTLTREFTTYFFGH